MLKNFKVRNLKDLRQFLGACNFYRRHVKNFSYSTAILTDFLKKNAKFQWVPAEEEKLQELKNKLASVTAIGVPRPTGEMIVVTDASDVGGGAIIFQWQSLSPEQVPQGLKTTGIFKERNFMHNYPENFRLVPIGHWDWKWNPTRQRYMTYEQELLAGVLTISTQSRILQSLPIVWFCDHEALKTFLDNEPPVNHRLRRWYCYLSQFKIKFVHIPGMKNEFCDWLSRTDFDHKFDVYFEKLAQEAFERMDSQLDLSLQVICLCHPLEVSSHFQEGKFRSPGEEVCAIRTFIKNTNIPLDAHSYEESELKEMWQLLEPWKAKVFKDSLWFRTSDTLFCERKLAIPSSSLPPVCK